MKSDFNQAGRRQFLKGMVLSTIPVLVYPEFGLSYLPVNRSKITTNDFVDAETAYGKVRGVRNEGVNTFKGIPYAGKVSGERRFRRPAQLEKWTGVRDALQLGAPAIQAPRRNEPPPNEDCLFLNIWTPANDSKKRPVMFYNHGGGYVIGSGGSRGQDGTNLAKNFDVVVVETNHRLGLLGFLYLDELGGPDYSGSGNMGILDITAGLKWVKENIAEFGGDPDNVMIFGESGGGGKTSCLYAMPDAAPFFNKASIESGPGVRMLTEEMAVETTSRVLKDLNIFPKDWRKLLDISAADLLAIQSKFSPVPPFQERRKSEGGPGSDYIGFGPVVDGVVLQSNPFDPTAPEISIRKPLMTGWNEDEWNFFAMQNHDIDFVKYSYDELLAKLESQFGVNADKIVNSYREARPDASPADIYVAIKSIAMMGLGTIEIAEKKVQQNDAPVYLYNFGYKSDIKIPGTDFPIGTPHAMDISFKFNNEVPPKKGEQPRMSFGGSNPDRFVASHKMAELWTTFARTGVPAAKDVPNWPAYDLKTRATMRIDVNCEVINDRYSKELQMWRSIGWL